MSEEPREIARQSSPEAFAFRMTREEMGWLAFGPGLVIAGEVREAQSRPLRKAPGSG
jgi:hypothetical protein